MNSRLISRNVTLGPRRTSMRLEPEVWAALEEICYAEDKVLGQVVMVAGQAYPGNLSSACRVYALAYFKQKYDAAQRRERAHAA